MATRSGITIRKRINADWNLRPDASPSRNARWIRSVALRVVHLPVTVAADAIEFQQPILEAFTRRHLAGAHFGSFRDPGDHRLGTCAACGRADAQQFGQGPFSSGRCKGCMEIIAPGEDFQGQYDQLVDPDVVRAPRPGPERRGEPLRFRSRFGCPRYCEPCICGRMNVRRN